MIVKKYYFPLKCQLIDDEGYELDVSNSYISEVEDDVKELLDKYQDFGDQKMHEFFDENDDVSDKLLSTVWSIETLNDEYYGCVTVELSDEIDEQGIADLKDWISGQNSDGLGEGFEQREIPVEDGNLYISFWNYSDDYFIYDEKEMNEYLNPSLQREKPYCALIGEDSNIFNLMSIASRTLRKHGMAEEANEMCTRIRASDNYYQALGVITEYVNVTSSEDMSDGKSFEQTM